MTRVFLECELRECLGGVCAVMPVTAKNKMGVQDRWVR